MPGEEVAAGDLPRVARPPEGPEAAALAEDAADIRRMIEAGAGSPEAIRELAERLREHRAREEALWRAEVRPVLRQEGKGRLRGHRKGDAAATPEPAAAPAAGGQALTIGLAMLALVVVVVIAANTTVWVLLAPVLALLAWAWVQGRDDLS